jgi:hypothetical protein
MLILIDSCLGVKIQDTRLGMDVAGEQTTHKSFPAHAHVPIRGSAMVLPTDATFLKRVTIDSRDPPASCALVAACPGSLPPILGLQ